ncbi:tripartite tricarboxylate transporter TctB family protein [Bengtsoniella intestinalis]|uniref:tripartite tricarboxylate transporter TctB family protein n=1 Tax=Bengtsoniella intestinalis TaxID=3073143 RepID=UPI00391FC148
MGELIFLGTIAILSIAMFFTSFSFPVSIIDKSGGAGLFPQLVIPFLLILLVARCVVILKDKKQRETKFVFLEIFQGRRLVFFLLFLVYSLTMTTLGFVIGSSLFLAVAVPFLYKLQMGTMMSKGRAVSVIACQTVCVVAMYYIFTNYFNVILPSGLLNF